MDSVFHVAFSQATTCDGGIQHSVKSKQNLKSFEKSVQQNETAESLSS